MMMTAAISTAKHGDPPRRGQFAHLAPVRREHHQRDDGEGQLQTQHDLTEDEQPCRAASRRTRSCTIAAGTIAILRVIKRRAQGGKLMSRKPSITI